MAFVEVTTKATVSWGLFRAVAGQSLSVAICASVEIFVLRCTNKMILQSVVERGTGPLALVVYTRYIVERRASPLSHQGTHQVYNINYISWPVLPNQCNR